MRCKNCHTVMMETDTHCLGCKSPAHRATADAPGEIQKPSAWLNLLPIFGGAAGGLIAGAIKNSTVSSRSSDYQRLQEKKRESSSGPNPFVKLIGIVFFVGGALLLVIGGAEALNTRNLENRQPKAMTGADLCRKDFIDTAPELVSFRFTESKQTNISVKRNRPGSSVPVDARCLLVRVEDQWLIADVGNGFDGNELVGRPVRFDPVSSKSLIEQANKEKPKPGKLLPYEFNGLDSSAGERNTHYTAAGILGGAGIVGLLLGLVMLRGSRKKSPTPTAEPNLKMQPLPAAKA